MMLQGVLTGAAQAAQAIPDASTEVAAGADLTTSTANPDALTATADSDVPQVSEDAYRTALSVGSAQSTLQMVPDPVVSEPNRAIFPADPSPGQVSRNASRQANPDLSLAAALVSLAPHRAGDITDLITSRQGDTYTVRFPGHDKPLTVVHPGPVDSGTWVKILEQAYGQTHADGSVPADPTFLLTGHYVDLTHTDRMSDDDIRSRLGTALGRDKVVCAYDGAARATWAVTAYNPDCDTISLRAANRNESNELSLEAFRARFSSVTIEN